MDGVVRLADELDRRVLTPSGETVGCVKDLTVRLGDARPAVARVLVRRGRDTAYLLPRHDVVRRVDGLELRSRDVLPAARVDPRHLPLQPGELLLGRDVLDTQVVDLRGRHLSRVSEVLLEADGDGLAVVAVDLGVTGVLRRLGLGALSFGAGHSVVEWQDVHLTSPRAHVVQLSTGAAPFRRLDEHGLAELLTRLDTPRATDVVRAVDPARAAAALHHSHPRTGRRIVRALSRDERQELVSGAAADHARTIVGLGGHVSPLRGRRFRRTEGWRLHRPPRG